MHPLSSPEVHDWCEENGVYFVLRQGRLKKGMSLLPGFLPIARIIDRFFFM
jgi:hypothetical protein